MARHTYNVPLDRKCGLATVFASLRQLLKPHVKMTMRLKTGGPAGDTAAPPPPTPRGAQEAESGRFTTSSTAPSPPWSAAGVSGGSEPWARLLPEMSTPWFPGMVCLGESLSQGPTWGTGHAWRKERAQGPCRAAQREASSSLLVGHAQWEGQWFPLELSFQATKQELCRFCGRADGFRKGHTVQNLRLQPGNQAAMCHGVGADRLRRNCDSSGRGVRGWCTCPQ